MSVRRGVGTTALVMAALCLSVPRASGEAATTPAGIDAPVPFDFQAIARRIHFAFRDEDGRFTGGHSTYAVEADARQFSIRPVLRSPWSRPAPVVGAPIVIDAGSIVRGRATIGPMGPLTLDETRRLVRRGSRGVAETIENKAEGVELSWTFPATPDGLGDLEVRVPVSGLEYAGATPGGLHFRDTVSGLGIRFGHATWIDSGGVRKGIPATWEAQAVVMRVPSRVVDGSAYPALLDPIIGPEHELDTPVVGPASSGQTNPATAHDPTSGNYLVAWTDGRAAASGQVFATRVDAAGVVLDPAGIAVSALPGPGSAYSPSVVFDGANFLIVFTQGCSTFARRISPAGVLVDAAPFAIANMFNVCQFNAFASNNGTTTLVAWQDGRTYPVNGLDIYGARVSGSVVLDPAGLAISTAPGDQLEPKVAHRGGDWIVVWEDLRDGQYDVYGARVNASGVVLDPASTGIAISALPASDQREPWPASDGNDYFVAWWDTRNSATNAQDTYGARVASTGTVLDPAGIRLCDNTSTQDAPSVAFGAGNYHVVWEDFRGPGLWGNRVSPSTGALVDGPGGTQITGPVPIATQVFAPQIYPTGSGFYVGWHVNDDGDVNVRGSRLPTTLLLLDAPGVALASSGNGQRHVAVAADDTNYLVVWSDDRGGEDAVYGARVDGATGVSLDPAGILLSAGGSHERAPAVAFNGTQYLVAWYDDRLSYGIWGTRVSTSGTVIDPVGLHLVTNGAGNAPDSPVIASDGSAWFMAWADYRDIGTTKADIYGARVGAAGVSLDPAGIAISNAAENQVEPRVAFGGGYYLVTWNDSRPVTDSDVYGARVSPSGVVQEPSGIPIATGPEFVDYSGHPVAYGGQNFVVAYSEGGALRRALIAPATGVVQDVATLAAPTNAVYRMAIAYGWSTFVVLYNVQSGTDYGLHIRGTRLDAAGADLDAVDWTVIVDAGVADDTFGVAARPAGSPSFLAVYTRYDPTPGITSDRARARQILPDVDADLAVTKTDGQTTAVPGEPLTYTITVSNPGPGPAPAVNVVDVFPAVLLGPTWTCVASPASSCTQSGAGDINDVVNLAVGGSITYTATGTVAPSATGVLANTATVTTFDQNPGNNSATDTDILTPEADLTIAKTDSVDPVAPGVLLTYTVSITNNGPSDATGVTVVDTLPAGVTFVSSIPGPPTCTLVGVTLTCTIGPLAAGAGATVSIDVTVNAGASGILVNTATVSGSETDPDPGNNTASAATAVGRRDGELAHGTDARYDLAAQPGTVVDEDVFRIAQQPSSSYEIVVDATSGDIGAGDGPLLERVDSDGVTVLQASVPIGTGSSRSLRWMNTSASEVEGETIRVRSAGCTTDCGPDDVYRIRAYETTYSIPRFNNSGTQVTVLVLQNPTDDVMAGQAYFWNSSGILVGTLGFGVSARHTVVFDTSTIPGVNGESGTITVANTMRYGEISGKAVALEAATGFSFDSPLLPRPR